MTDVYLHVGLPKTGTTSMQRALTEHASELAAAGVLVPGGRHIEQRRAAYDLIGLRQAGDDGPVTGAFERLVAEMVAYQGNTIVFSEEGLAAARRRHARQLVEALAPHRVHVVLTVRDLARLLTSAWQQSVVMGRGEEWPEYLASVRDPEHGTISLSTKFWLKHDITRVLDVWGTVVPPERVIVVTVPPPGTPAGVLFVRFGEAIGVPARLWAIEGRSHNVGLGTIETEVLRRMNVRLGGALVGMPYRWTVEDGIRRSWRAEHYRSPRLTVDDLAWARTWSEQIVADLASRGHRIVGDLTDLIPTQPPSDPPPVTEAELLAGTERALAALAVSYGELRGRHRRLLRRQADAPVPATVRARSRIRTAGYVALRSALELADRVPPLAWLARRYVARR
jgi:hypothetical protein